MSTPSTASGTPPATASPVPAPRKRSSLGLIVAAIVIVVVVIVAGLYFAKVGPFATSSPAPAPQQAGGFTKGAVVTFVYTGAYSCTPALLSFFPNETTAASKTNCEAGAADQSAIQQVPEWVLVPAFAGLSIFGVTALNATARGFPTFQASPLLTDCGAGGSPTACSDHPAYLYSPAFTAVEEYINITSGYGGLPEGVLPTPAHDHLIDTAPTFPNVQWGTIVVLVFDPDIWPDRATGTCSAVVASNLSSPKANCLVSLTALEAALTTESSAVAAANGGNPIWQALGSPTEQVVVPGDVTVTELNNLNANLYIPFSVQPGAPASFPS